MKCYWLQKARSKHLPPELSPVLKWAKMERDLSCSEAPPALRSEIQPLLCGTGSRTALCSLGSGPHLPQDEEQLRRGYSSPQHVQASARFVSHAR